MRVVGFWLHVQVKEGAVLLTRLMMHDLFWLLVLDNIVFMVEFFKSFDV